MNNEIQFNIDYYIELLKCFDAYRKSIEVQNKKIADNYVQFSDIIISESILIGLKQKIQNYNYEYKNDNSIEYYCFIKKRLESNNERLEQLLEQDYSKYIYELRRIGKENDYISKKLEEYKNIELSNEEINAINDIYQRKEKICALGKQLAQHIDDKNKVEELMQLINFEINELKKLNNNEKHVVIDKDEKVNNGEQQMNLEIEKVDSAAYFNDYTMNGKKLDEIEANGVNLTPSKAQRKPVNVELEQTEVEETTVSNSNFANYTMNGKKLDEIEANGISGLTKEEVKILKSEPANHILIQKALLIPKVFARLKDIMKQKMQNFADEFFDFNEENSIVRGSR